MSVVVGFGPDARTNSGLELASQIARTSGEELVLCCVVQDRWSSPALRDPAGIDDDYQRQVRTDAQAALAAARDRLPDDLSVTQVVRSGRSVPTVLQTEGVARGARLLVVGSATHGAFGHISLGSTSESLVHSSATPVGLAPRGYRATSPRIGRVVIAIRPGDDDQQIADSAAALCDWLSVPARVVTFAVRDRSAMTVFADQGVFEQWQLDAVAAQATFVRQLEQAGVAAGADGVVIGERWSRAMEAFEWAPGDLLVVGSSAHGQVARVFLGSSASRILRSCPMPAVLLSRR